MNRREMTQRITLALAGSHSMRASEKDESDWLGSGTITDVPGIKVGHHTLKTRPTGCTVILCEAGAVAGVDVRGAAPGTRETDLLNPVNSVQQVQAVVLSGGSAYGLDTASGVMRYLESQGKGFKIAGGVVPIVPAAILMDLAFGGDFTIRPDADAGYQACRAATNKPVEQGNIGAGAGSTIGKMFGGKFSMKAGIGSASIKVGNTGIVVGAIVAVNAVGDIVNPKTGKIVAGARTDDGKSLRDSMGEVMKGYRVTMQQGANTTIGLVATNAKMEKVQVSKMAQMAHDGFARAINPVHTLGDGDTIFALATGTVDVRGNHGMIGALAAEAMAQAIVRAATAAGTSAGVPGLKDWKRG